MHSIDLEGRHHEEILVKYIYILQHIVGLQIAEEMFCNAEGTVCDIINLDRRSLTSSQQEYLLLSNTVLSNLVTYLSIYGNMEPGPGLLNINRRIPDPSPTFIPAFHSRSNNFSVYN
jgi:hypothetical protein